MTDLKREEYEEMNQINYDDKGLKKNIQEKSGRSEIYKESIENIVLTKINLLSTSDINRFIKNLSRPQFLGSIHLRKDTNLNKNAVNDILSGELQIKLSKTLKNPSNNPITRYLIFLMILFNVLWIIFFYIV